MVQLIEINNSCKNYHVLPRAGGLFDQDARLMYLLARVEEYAAARQDLDNKKKEGGQGGS